MSIKQAETSNEDTSMHKEVPDAVVVFSNNSDVAPISFFAPRSLIVDNVQAMLDLALTKKKEEAQTMYKPFLIWL